MLITAHSHLLNKLRPVLMLNLKLFSSHHHHHARRRIFFDVGLPPKRRLHFQNIPRPSALISEVNSKCRCACDAQTFPPRQQRFGSANVSFYGKWSSWLISGSRGLSSTSSYVNLEIDPNKQDDVRGRPSSKTRNRNNNGPRSNDNSPSGASGGERRTMDQVVYHLQADIRRRRRIHKAEIHNAVDLVEKASRVDDFGSFLLNCCSDILPDIHPNNRVNLAQRIWSVIQKSKDYSVAHFEAMLKSLALNEDKSSDPFSFLAEAKANNIEVTGTMYFFALLIICQRGDIEAVVKILTMMKADNVAVNEKFFNVLITGNARRGDLKGAAEILDIMRASSIEPSSQTWTSLLQAYIEAGDKNLVRTTFSSVVGSGLTEDQFYELLRTAGRQPREDIFDVVIDRALDSKKMRYLSIMNVCVQLMYGGHCQNALKLILKFKEALLSKKEPLGSFFIKELHATNVDCETYLKLIMSLQGDDRNPFALNMAAESCLKHKKLNLAFAIFEGMSVVNVPVRPHYFVPPLLLELEQKGINGAVQVLIKMRAMDVQPDWEMLVNWIVPKIFDVEENMIKVLKIVHETSGIAYSSGLLSAGLAVSIGRGKLVDAVKIVDSLKGKLTHPEVIMQKLTNHMTAFHEDEAEQPSIEQPIKSDLTGVIKILKFITDNVPSNDNTDHVGAFILKLIELDRADEAETILEAISNEIGISISADVAATIKDKMKLSAGAVNVNPQLQFVNAASIGKQRVIHPNQMDLPDLECHKEELEAKSLNTRGIYRKLFLKYCQVGDLHKALEIKEKFQAEFGNISRGMKSALMGNYIQNKVLKQALELYHELSQPERDDEEDERGELDTYKLIDLATLLIEKGLIEDGTQLVEYECLTRTDHRPETFQRNVVRLLKTLAIAECSSADSEKKSEGNVLRLTELFLKDGFMKPSNPNLAPSIKYSIMRGQIDEAVTKIETYTMKYKLTPCLQELTYATLNNPALLERVVKCSAATRGLRESKRLLALAKSDVGDLDGAAAIFRELAGQLSFVSLLKQCEYLVANRETDKLLNLISSLQKTGRNYDCKKLYDIATNSCQRSEDQEGLKKIILHMEENDQFVSPTLKESAGQQRR